MCAPPCLTGACSGLQKLRGVPIIAEDLGVITPDVHELREAIGAPGMVVLQFAWGSGATNTHLPHNHYENSVCYPGQFSSQAPRGLQTRAFLALPPASQCLLPDLRTPEHLSALAKFNHGVAATYLHVTLKSKFRFVCSNDVHATCSKRKRDCTLAAL